MPTDDLLWLLQRRFPFTRSELQESIGVSKVTARRRIREWHARGLIRPAGFKKCPGADEYKWAPTVVLVATKGGEAWTG